MEKRLGEKGFTVVELMLAFTLSMIVIVYLFNVILGIKNLYTDDGIRTQMLIKQSGITQEMETEIQGKLVTKVNTCGSSCIRFEYADGTTSDLGWDEGNRTVSFNNHKVQYIKGAEIGAPNVKIEKTAGVTVGKNNSVVTIHIPVTHKLIDEDFGVHLVYPYDDRVTDIPDMGPEDFLSVKLTGSVGNGVATKNNVTLTAKPRPLEKDMLGGYTYTWQRQEGSVWKTLAQNREDKLSITTEVNHLYRVIITNIDENTATSNTYKVIVDKTAPSCQISVSGTAGNNGWYKTKSISLTLATEDGPIGSGVVGYDLTSNSSPTYGNTKAVVQGDTKGITYYGYSKDAAGNVSTCTSGGLKVDTVAPGCTSSGGNPNWTNGNITLVGTCGDGTSGCAGNVSKAFTSNTNLTNQSPGTVYDNAGNSAVCTSNQTVKIDKTPPACSISVSGTVGNNGWYKGHTTNTLNRSDDGGSGVANYGLTISGSTTYNGVASGTQGDTGGSTWYGYIKDGAGNVNSCATAPYKVDATPPSCSSSGGNGAWTNGSRTLTGYCTDGLSSCTGNASYYINWEGNWTNLSPGTVYDKAGNSTACPSNQTVRIDKTPPSCSSSGGSGAWTSGSRTLTGSCSDNAGGSGCTGNASYTINWEENRTDRSPGSVSDAAGNSTGCPANQTVRIDKTAPSKPSISNPTGGSCTDSPFSLTVSTNETGSGVAYWQYRYGGTSWTTYSNSASSTFKTTPFSAARNEDVYIRACDNTGNCSNESTTRIYIGCVQKLYLCRSVAPDHYAGGHTEVHNTPNLYSDQTITLWSGTEVHKKGESGDFYRVYVPGNPPPWSTDNPWWTGDGGVNYGYIYKGCLSTSPPNDSQFCTWEDCPG